VVPNSKIAWISEELCIGCGICVKVIGVLGSCCTKCCVGPACHGCDNGVMLS
jgi:hypothetical protein